MQQQEFKQLGPWMCEAVRYLLDNVIFYRLARHDRRRLEMCVTSLNLVAWMCGIVTAHPSAFEHCQLASRVTEPVRLAHLVMLLRDRIQDLKECTVPDERGLLLMLVNGFIAVLSRTLDMEGAFPSVHRELVAWLFSLELHRWLSEALVWKETRLFALRLYTSMAR